MSVSFQDQHVLELSNEILLDIEGNRISASAIVLKADRLASLVGNDQISEWLYYEKHGYTTSEEAKKYLYMTSRVLGSPTHRIAYGSISTQESSIESTLIRIEDLKRNPESPKPLARYAATRTVDVLSNALIEYRKIISRVLATIHKFASGVYYEKLFSNITKDLFTEYKDKVDSKLAGKCGAVLDKVPAVFRRLEEEDSEAISHALTSCRRIIDAFADSVYPPRQPITGGDGKEILLTDRHHLNRINEFVKEKTDSASRRQKLRRTLSDIYDRVSAGVHSDVSPEEARGLFIQTYVVLGEIISL